MFRQTMKYAFRNVIRQKWYTIINIAGLAVGLAFAMLVLFWVRYELSVDRYHEHIDQIYVVAFSGDDGNFRSDYTVSALGPYLQDTYPEIIHATRYAQTPQFSFEYEGEKYPVNGSFADPDFLNIFSFDVVEGSSENALQNPLSVVITHSLADRIFGEKEALGQALRLSEQLTLMVSAVVDDAPITSRFQFDFLLSCNLFPNSFNKWDVKSLNTFVRLAPGTNPDHVTEKIRNVYNDKNPGTYPNYQYLFPLRDLYVHGLKDDGRIIYIKIFSILAIIILFIACINFMNLSTARAFTRYHEIGLKKVLGAKREQLACQFLIEAGFITLAAMLISIVIRKANPSSHLSIKYQATGLAITPATITRIINSLNNKFITFATDAPSTLRILISRALCRAVKAARPNRPRQEMKMAMTIT